MRGTWLMAAVVVGAMTSMTMAEVGIVRGGAKAPAPDQAVRSVVISAGAGQRRTVVVRDVVEPAAVVDRALREQPVYTDLVEVRLANATTIYLYPEVNYQRQGHGVLDGNHTYLRALRLYRAIVGGGVGRVDGGPAEAMERPAAGIQPRAILLRPDWVRPRNEPDNGSQQPPIPQVPRQPEKADGQVALAN